MNWIQLAEGVHHWNVLMKAAVTFGTFGIPKNACFKGKTCEAVPVHAMKAYRGAEVYSHSLLTSAQDGGEWSSSCPRRFIPPFPTPEKNSVVS